MEIRLKCSKVVEIRSAEKFCQKNSNSNDISLKYISWFLVQVLEKLGIDENYYLYRRAIDDREQLLHPKKLRLLVYLKLHVKMGYLGSGRTVELIKERFYWPKLTEDMRTKLCTYVKSKKSNITHEDPMKSVTSSSPSTDKHWFSTFRSLQWRLWIPASYHKVLPSIPNNKQECKNSSWKVI